MNQIDPAKVSPTLFISLTSEDQDLIREKAAELHLSVQHTRLIIEAATDLRLWGEPPISHIWDETGCEHYTGKVRAKHILARLFNYIEHLRSSEISYDNFNQAVPPQHKQVYVEQEKTDATLLGLCPVAGEKTRCCNLQTLDVVTQCGFGCSYCSIRSFYDKNRVYIHSNLAEKLQELEIDPDTIYHIGTGQSSDSLMWGNRGNLLTDIFRFAENNPNIILELKTKSDRLDWLGEIPVPANVVITWSLNTPTIITHEEHYTASLERRLAAAERCAEAGILVGFHLHPMIKTVGWKEAYGQLIQQITSRFTPEQTMMISFGTLTFIKPVVQELRTSSVPSKVLQIPLAQAAGKYSYPLETKTELFSFAYQTFPEAWKREVFFYLCMEDPSLWEPVFGFSYPSNSAFEAAMKQAYMHKIRTHSASKKRT